MSIGGNAFSNALSGLTAARRASELVSSNVANAMTPGYGRRELELGTRYAGAGTTAGVNVVAVRREVDAGLLEDRRLADAAAGYDNTVTKFHSEFSNILGTPDEPGSLSARLATLETTFIEASSRPDSAARLSAVVTAANDVVNKLNKASDQIQEARMAADGKIDVQVRQLNEALTRVHNLNLDIKRAVAKGEDPSTLQDLRQQSVDKIASIVPIKMIERDKGTIALYTTGNAVILDGKAGEFAYSKVGVIVPEMTLDSGALSGLTLNGNSIETSGNFSPIKGGSLAALFEVRDELATGAQSQLDAISRDLIERFQDPAIDGTRAPGDPGLFTDGGSAFDIVADPDSEVALSERIRLNALVDPDQGGEVWRLRDGLGAVTPGEVGNSALLQDLYGAMTEKRVAASGDFLGVARSASGLSADLLSIVGADLSSAEDRQTYSSSQQTSLIEMEKAAGVDTDYELQQLVLIEQAYTANAKVLTTLDNMMRRLMEI
ncbi:MAG: flagellar hook-associated protein FlgK [Maritimibacter sp.]